MKNFTFVFTIIFSIFLSIFLPVSAFATGSEENITVSPFFIERKSGLDNLLNESFDVINNTSNPLSLKLSASIKKDNVLVTELSEEADWIKFNKQTVDIAPNSKATIDYSVIIPSDAKDFFYNFVIIGDSSSAGTGSAGVNQLITHEFLLILTENNTHEASLTLEKFRTNGSFIFKSPLDYELEIVNKSNDKISKPIIYFQIVNPKNEVVYQSVLNEQLEYLYPSQKIYKTIDYKFETTSYDDIGKYRAEVLIVDQISEKSYFYSKNVYVLPYQILILIFLLIILIYTLLVLMRKRIAKVFSFKKN